jgi:hypothetical protein
LTACVWSANDVKFQFVGFASSPCIWDVIEDDLDLVDRGAVMAEATFLRNIVDCVCAILLLSADA